MKLSYISDKPLSTEPEAFRSASGLHRIPTNSAVDLEAAHLDKRTEPNIFDVPQQSDLGLRRAFAAPRLKKWFVRSCRNSEHVPVGIALVTGVCARTLAAHVAVEYIKEWAGKKPCVAPISLMVGTQLVAGLIGIKAVSALSRILTHGHSDLKIIADQRKMATYLGPMLGVYVAATGITAEYILEGPQCRMNSAVTFPFLPEYLVLVGVFGGMVTGAMLVCVPLLVISEICSPGRRRMYSLETDSV